MAALKIDLDLATRPGLPEALQVLLQDYPRLGWESHPHFSGLVQFWLERHMMFRQILGTLQTDVQQGLDRNIEAQQYAARLGRLGSMLVGQLQGHHQIEDHHYFPVLAKLDARITPGFDILDKDHHAMGGLLNRFAGAANGVLGAVSDADQFQDQAGDFLGELATFQRMLDRHLNDEEELIVPVILNNGGAGLS